MPHLQILRYCCTVRNARYNQASASGDGSTTAADTSSDSTAASTSQTSTVSLAAARFQQRKAAFAAMFPAIQAAVDPTNQVHSIAAECSAFSAIYAIEVNVLADNGGTLQGFAADMVNSAMTRVFQAYNMTVTPSTGGAEGDSANSPPTLPDGTVDPFVAFCCAILGFLESNVVSPDPQ